jgi:hypothetical protein
MTVIDKILNEWSFRCHDGIVDINDPKKVKILQEILEEDVDDDILNVLTQIDDEKAKSKILNYLRKINKKEDKIEDKEKNQLEAKLSAKGFNEEQTEYVSLLADKYDTADELLDYLNSSLMGLNDLGESGNLFNIIKNKTNLNDNFIKRIITYTPSEKKKALGIGEIALALFFDAEKQEVGDIKMGNKLIELKGSSARFPGLGKGRSGDIGDLYNELSQKYPNITLKSKESSLAIYIKRIIEEDPNSLNYINDKLNNIYPNTNDIKISIEDIKSGTINNKLNQKYVASYVKNHNNDYYMLISKDTSNFDLYTPEELISSAGNGDLPFIGNITKSNSFPQIAI